MFISAWGSIYKPVKSDIKEKKISLSSKNSQNCDITEEKRGLEAVFDSVNEVELEKEEVNFAEAFKIIKKHFWKIVIFLILFNSFMFIKVHLKPNVYSSFAILAMHNDDKDLTGDTPIPMMNKKMDLTIDYFYNSLTTDKEFMFKFIKKYSLHKKLIAKDMDKNFVYKSRIIYDTKKKFMKKLKGKQEIKPPPPEEELIFEAYNILQGSLAVSTDDESPLITIKVQHPDRVLAKEIIDAFLKFSSEYLRNEELEIIDRKIEFYNEELFRTNDLVLKRELLMFISKLIQKKVLAKSSKFFGVREITLPKVSHPKEKVKPNRKTTMVLSVILSSIMGAFLAIIWEIFKRNKYKGYSI